MLRILKNIILYPIGVLIILLLIPYVVVLLIHHHLMDDTRKDWVDLSEFGRLGTNMAGRGKK